MTLDLWVGVLVLSTLFALEAVLPFYLGRRDRVRHAARNLGLAAIGGLVGALLAPLLSGATQLSAHLGLGLCHWVDAPGLGCGLAAFILFDLWMYAWHRANHRIPSLWRLHRVHHTDPSMDCTTALRFHPGEILLSGLANVLVLMLLGMSFELLVLYKAVMVAIIGLHHSNLALPAAVDRALRLVLVTPAIHRVHHSEIRAETDSSYGTVFSVWDRLFGSLRLRPDPQAIRFGIGRYAEPRWQRLSGLLMLPLQSEFSGMPAETT
ncbi:sterol desaturase family protein [Thiorhodococcus mannitoliphagus]|uniref:Sterol desaturase family protein n=1 Tax=Thiorhodococcus mannitoliphagus TaxID=329406 RepID=A0A6P1DLS3_9GAMM|nr:sterol desaturase family protein [Thiorhodococcus mannitoliphagus]NEX18998.1 sterol desaturase family protein [Thiorhodococcus mannitoliphagus]